MEDMCEGCPVICDKTEEDIKNCKPLQDEYLARKKAEKERDKSEEQRICASTYYENEIFKLKEALVGLIQFHNDGLKKTCEVLCKTPITCGDEECIKSHTNYYSKNSRGISAAKDTKK
jgi:hypothetical protein